VRLWRAKRANYEFAAIAAWTAKKANNYLIFYKAVKLITNKQIHCERISACRFLFIQFKAKNVRVHPMEFLGKYSLNVYGFAKVAKSGRSSPFIATKIKVF